MVKKVDIAKLKECADKLHQAWEIMSEVEEMVHEAYKDTEDNEHLCGYYTGALLSAHLLVWHIGTDILDDIEGYEDSDVISDD